MYEYKKVSFELTSSNLRTSKVQESLDELFAIIEKNAEDGWRFVQVVHPYTTNTTCMIVFEKEKR
ncbi:MAG: DUF4177 domain-containing protein [Sporomusa sp.]